MSAYSQKRTFAQSLTSLRAPPSARRLKRARTPLSRSPWPVHRPTSPRHCFTDVARTEDAWSRDEWCQPRWAYLFDTGLIDAVTAEQMADGVWDDGEIVIELVR